VKLQGRNSLFELRTVWSKAKVDLGEGREMMLYGENRLPPS